MALTKEVLIDQITILEEGVIQTREVTRIMEDGVVLSFQYTNRKIIEPGQDVSEETQKVKEIVSAVHKPEVVSAYTTKVAAKQAEEAAKQAAAEEPK